MYTVDILDSTWLYTEFVLWCITFSPKGRSEGRVGRHESGSGASESFERFGCSYRSLRTDDAIESSAALDLVGRVRIV